MTATSTYDLHQQVIREACPELLIKTARPYSQAGQFNDTLVVNDELIFRFPKYPEGARRLTQTVHILNGLRAYVSLPIPEPIYTHIDPPAAGRTFMGYRLIPGSALDPARLARIESEEARQRLAAQLAGFLQELHGAPLSTLGAGVPLCDTPAEWAGLYADIRSHLFKWMRPDAREWVRAHFEAFLNRPALHAYPVALRHGDFGPGNILYDSHTLSVSGIIDFDFAGVGDPALDIAAVSCLGEPIFQRVYPAYPVSDTMWERAQFYKGTYALQEALHGFRNGDRAAFESGPAEYV